CEADPESEQALDARALLIRLLHQQRPDAKLREILALAEQYAPAAFAGRTPGIVQNYIERAPYEPFADFREVFSETASSPPRIALLRASESLNYANAIRDGFLLELQSVYGEDWAP